MMGNTDWTPGSDRQLIHEYQISEDGAQIVDIRAYDAAQLRERIWRGQPTGHASEMDAIIAAAPPLIPRHWIKGIAQATALAAIAHGLAWLFGNS